MTACILLVVLALATISVLNMSNEDGSESYSQPPKPDTIEGRLVDGTSDNAMYEDYKQR